MPTNRAKSFILAMCAAFVLIGCGGSESTHDDDVVTVTTSFEYADRMALFLKDFKEEYPNRKVRLSVRESEDIYYYLRRGTIWSDCVAVEDLSALNQMQNLLLDMSSSEYLTRFGRYIRNYLKAEDGTMRCLPSPGGVYGYCVNLDLLEKYNLEIPNTIDGLIDFSTYIQNYVSPYASYAKDEQYYMQAFLQASVPSYFATAQGSAFFDDYAKGNALLQQNPDANGFLSAMNSFSSLFRTGFFQKGKDYVGDAAFFNGKAAILFVGPNDDFESSYKKYGSTFRYEFMPLLSEDASEPWLLSNSDFYFATLKSHYVGEKAKTIDALNDFFSSPDGQRVLMCDSNRKRLKNYVSYLNSAGEYLTGPYAKIRDVAARGYIYLVDQFTGIFGQCLDSIGDFAEDRISTNTLVDDLDYSVTAYLNYQNNVYEVEAFKGSSDDLSLARKQIIPSVASMIKDASKADVVFLPYSFLKKPIFNGLLYEDELSFVFDSSLKAIPWMVKGDVLSELLAFAGEGLAIAGYRFDSSGSNGKLDNGQAVNPNATYMVLLPESLPCSSGKQGNERLFLDLYRGQLEMARQ